MLRNVTTAVAALLIAVAVSAHAQSSRPQFEVASVKPNTGENSFFAVGPLQPGGRFVITGATLKDIMGFAFHGRIQDSQLVGGPGWLDTLRWDIDAKMPEGTIPPGGPRDPCETNCTIDVAIPAGRPFSTEMASRDEGPADI